MTIINKSKMVVLVVCSVLLITGIYLYFTNKYKVKTPVINFGTQVKVIKPSFESKYLKTKISINNVPVEWSFPASLIINDNMVNGVIVEKKDNNRGIIETNDMVIPFEITPETKITNYSSSQKMIELAKEKQTINIYDLLSIMIKKDESTGEWLKNQSGEVILEMVTFYE